MIPGQLIRSLRWEKAAHYRPYLTASAIHTERIPQGAADNSVGSSPSRNAGVNH